MPEPKTTTQKILEWIGFISVGIIGVIGVYLIYLIYIPGNMILATKVSWTMSGLGVLVMIYLTIVISVYRRRNNKPQSV